MLSAFKTAIAQKIRDESGAAALIIAALIMTIGFTALSIFLNNNLSAHKLAAARSGAASQTSFLSALQAYYQSAASATAATLPCPDTANPPTGTAATTCDGTSGHPNSGVLPWVTLGLSRDQAIDPYGNFYTYVVSPTAKSICKSVTSDFDASKQLTGGLLTSSLNVSLSDGTNPQSVPFAVISHGADGTGALSGRSSTANKYTGTPTSTAEQKNCHKGSPSCATTDSMTTIYSGPSAPSPATSVFDDQVSVLSPTVLTKMCANLTPGGALNATMSDNFDGTSALDTTKYDAASTATQTSEKVTVNGTSQTTGNQVANFAGGGATLATNTVNYNFDPTILPRYVSAIWSPDVLDPTAANTSAGISVSTRVTLSTRSGVTDDFSTGLTFRFYNKTLSATTNITTTGTANTISIRSNGAELTNSGVDTYKLIHDKKYLLEVYDDGATVWARISQTDDLSNSATVGPLSTSINLTGENRIVFVNGPTRSYIDNLIAGKSMLALETDGTGGVVTTPNLNVSSASGLTLEAWIRLKKATSAQATIMASYDPNDTVTANNNNAFRLYLDSAGQLNVQLKGAGTAAQNYPLSLSPALNEWNHIAVAFDTASKKLTFYLNGAYTSQSTTSISGGINAGTLPFTVGADSKGAVASSGATGNYFAGDISDVRVWNKARSSTEIGGDYITRLSYSNTSTVANLVLNWKLDQESGGLSSTTALSTGGAVSNPTGTLYPQPASATATVSGTFAGGNQVSLTITNAAITNSPKVETYTLGALDGATEVAAGLAALINADSDLQNAYVTASSSLGVVTVRHQGAVGNSTILSALPAPTGSESVVFSPVNGHLSGGSGPSGSFTGIGYIGAIANYLRPSADTVCPNAGVSGLGTVAGAYQCDFRSNAQSTTAITPFTVPTNLRSISAQIWGAGGGGFDDIAQNASYKSTGGGGGFSVGSIAKISTTSIAGTSLDIIVGGGGSGSYDAADNVKGAGGGGTSALRLHTGTVPGLVAGGGGGASFSNDSNRGCDLLVGNASTQCGLGGGGGGASATSTRAPDGGTLSGTNCAGRGGDSVSFGNEPPTVGTDNATHKGDCKTGGDDPTSTTGASGGGSHAGGASLAGPGGAGYDGSAAGSHHRIGAGGAGGGISNSTFTAGGGEGGAYDNTADFHGYGGGGGSGYVDSNVTASHGAAATPGTAGGTSGPFYSPTYATTFGHANPGKGGTTGSTGTTGNDGAVILTW